MAVSVGVVFAPSEEYDPTSTHEAIMQDVVIVVLDLRTPGPLVKLGFGPRKLHGTVTEKCRGYSVELRRLV